MPGRVLIIDDDEMARSVIQQQLESAGYEVFIHPVAEKISGALIRTIRPVVVLCGLDLPGVAPERYIPLMQTLKSALGVRTILISNLAPGVIEERAKLIGADAWFEKSRFYFDAQTIVEQAREDAPTAVSKNPRPKSGSEELIEKLQQVPPQVTRDEPRVRVVLSCTAFVAGAERDGKVLDISASGLFVAITPTPARGDRMTVDFRLPDGTPIRAETNVLWSREGGPNGPAGVGLKFAFLIPEDREALEKVVRDAVPELFK